MHVYVLYTPCTLYTPPYILPYRLLTPIYCPYLHPIPNLQNPCLRHTNNPYWINLWHNDTTIICSTYTRIYPLSMTRPYPRKTPCDVKSENPLDRVTTNTTHNRLYTHSTLSTMRQKWKTHMSCAPHNPNIHHTHPEPQTAPTKKQNTQKRCYHHETIPMLSPTIVLSPPNHV